MVRPEIAFVFPGQGAQKVGMGKGLYKSSPAAKKVFQEADEALGENLSKLIFEGPSDELTLTANTQPAILTVSIAALNAFREKSDIEPVLVAGHSLGEFSALVASGAMALGDAVRTTRARGTFMQEAVPSGEGAMAAVVGELTEKEISEICQQASDAKVVSTANLNAPNQIVISGHREAVERATAIATERGARTIPLSVSAPFHSALMEPAARRLAETLEKVELRAPKMPVVTNVEARPNSDAGRIRDLLVNQVTAPVRWVESINYSVETGVKTFIEFGPGRVLAGLIRRITREATVYSLESTEGIEKALNSIEKR